MNSKNPTTMKSGGRSAGFLDRRRPQTRAEWCWKYCVVSAFFAVFLLWPLDFPGAWYRSAHAATAASQVVPVRSVASNVNGPGFGESGFAKSGLSKRVPGTPAQLVQPPGSGIVSSTDALVSAGRIALGRTAAGVLRNSTPTATSDTHVFGKDAPIRYVLTDVVINRRDIFGAVPEADEIPGSRAVYRLVDRLHVTTREKTILREIDLQPGHTLFVADVAELERNLRALGLFASVSVTLIPGDAEQAELHINTRDRLSIVFGASGSFLGGIGELGFTVGERNVAGLGDRLLLSYSGTTDGQLRGAVGYDDIHFVDHSHKASYSAGRTEEGRFYHLKISRPFKTLASKLSWSVEAESITSEIDYYDNGVSVAQVPQRSDTFIVDSYRQRATGQSLTGNRFFRYGALVRLDKDSYEPTTGLQPDRVTAPLDNTRIFAGGLVALNRNSRYEKTSGVDSVRFTEDLSFGYSIELLAGLNQDTASDNSSEVTPGIFLNAHRSFGSALRGTDSNAASNSRLFGRTFGKASFSGNTNLQSGDEQSWSAGATLKLFNRSFDSHTLATRISYIASGNGNDLPVQYTLGENNGLRGYLARQFSGSNRVRINIEDRIDAGWRIGVFDLGLLAFVDAGWAGDDVSQLSLKKSAGIGLRLGSNSFLGADIIRLDLAYPFDTVDDNPGLSLSLSLGQVFTF